MLKRSVDRAALARCVERDLAELDELGTAVATAKRLRGQVHQAALPARRKVCGLHDAVLAVQHRAGANRTALRQIRDLLRRRSGPVRSIRLAAMFHDHLHGVGVPPCARTQAVNALPHGELAEVLEAGENLSSALWSEAHWRRDDFARDLDQLRSWLGRVPELRAPDRLVLLTDHGHEVLRHPRPAVRGRQPNSGDDVEILSAAQLDLLHAGMVKGWHAQRVAEMAGTSTYRAIDATVRCGSWLRRHLGVRRPTSRPVFGRTRMSTSWLAQHRAAAKGDVLTFAWHYRPQLGAWYQIERGDVLDLLGLSPMGSVHHRALLAHVVAGGVLSDFAAQDGRRYREVVAAWTAMVEHTATLQQVEQQLLQQAGVLPTRHDHVREHALAEQARSVRVGLRTLSLSIEDNLASSYQALADAVKDGSSTTAGAALRAYRAVLNRHLARVRRYPVATSPLRWGRRELESFERSRGLAGAPDLGLRARAIESIRAEVRRLGKCGTSGRPQPEYELLTLLHRTLASALRNGTEPELPLHWRLWLSPGAPDAHVWQAFQVWPDLIVLAASTP
ncbi:hypothetical protein JOF53_000022 [Crossiella equi]|uniref:Uncharacterized protein n=1 Tax=Crossiella equi TaxID=130796 RepID=A0ABS5A3K1_9PSEU|nr:hypothetical protein [Crossiella equi]MBP2471150.1 hypothetical protein [Crossiella equi]